MSHFTQVTTVIKSLSALERAVKKAGYTVNENKVVRGWGSQKKTMDFSINAGTSHDIGFSRQNNGCYSMEADWMGMDQTKVTNTILQNYSYEVVVEEARAKGFSIVEEEKQRDGTMRLLVRKWT